MRSFDTRFEEMFKLLKRCSIIKKLFKIFERDGDF